MKFILLAYEDEISQVLALNRALDSVTGPVFDPDAAYQQFGEPDGETTTIVEQEQLIGAVMITVRQQKDFDIPPAAWAQISKPRNLGGRSDEQS